MAVAHRFPAVPLATASVLVLSGCITVAPPEEDPEPPSSTQVPATAPAPTEEPPPSAPPAQVAPQPASIPPEVPPDWADTLEQVSTGVTPISIATCGSEPRPAGTGFLVGEDLIATAAHVVDGAASLTVGPAGSVSEAEVIGFSAEADLALLRIPEPVDGHVFTWPDQPLRVGQEVSALGFPLSLGFSSVQGSISSVNPRVEGFSDAARYLQTDAPTNPGNSGGPLVTIDGAVAGVVLGGYEYTGDRPVEGMNYALSHESTQLMVEDWAASPEPPSPVECPVEPGVPESTADVSVDVTVASDDENAAELAQLLALHGNAINTSQYDVAFGLFTPSLQERMEGLETWRSGLLSTFWRELAILDVTGSTDAPVVHALVRTEQLAEDGPDGRTCSIWALDYTMVLDEQQGTWLIDEVAEREDPQAC